MPYIGRELDSGNYLKLDDISSSFNGSTTTFNLTAAGKAFFPGSAFSILVNLAGVAQEPESAYQINNATITFATAPVAGDQFFCIVLGVAHGVNVPGNGTVNGAQLAKPFNYDGYFYLDDANNRVGIATATPQKPLHVVGEGQFDSVRVLGDLTVDGTTTTLDTVVTEVDKLEVGANNSTVGVAITQSGSGDILNLYDGASSVFSVADGGTVTASGDISIADKIIHTGDTNTAIRFPAGDTVTVETNGNERFRIAPNGNIGIGDNGPSERLEVRDTGNTTIRIHNEDDSEATVYFHNTGSNDRKIVTANADMIFYGGSGAGTEHVRIKSTGAVGIGTNSPQSQFEVYGTSPIVRSKHSTSQKYTQINHNGTDGYVDWSSGGLIFRGASNTERVRITSDGKIGIGVTNPEDLLHLSASNHGIGADFTLGKNILRFEDTDITQSNNQFTGGIIFEGHDGDSNAAGLQAAITCNAASSGGNGGSQLRFYTTIGGSTINGSSTEKLRITSTGKLEAYKGTSTTGKTSGSEAFTVGNGAGNHRFAVYPDGTTVIGGTGLIGNYNILLQNDGVGVFDNQLLIGLTTGVGVGGVPADLNSTEVGRGFINISRDDTAAADHILFGKNGSIAASMGTDTTNTLVFKTGTTERLRITSDGKIGINNSAPLYAMHFKNAMSSSPSFIHMEVTGSNAVGGGGGIAFDTSASNNASNNTLYLATIKGVRNSADDGSNDLVFSTTKAGVTGDDGNTHSPKEKLRITSAGLVGIGTDSPTTMLEVGNQSKTLAGAITVSNGEIIGGGTGPVITLKHGPAGGTQRTHQIYSYIGDLRIVADSNENMEFHTGGSESLRIKSTGVMQLGNPNLRSNITVPFSSQPRTTTPRFQVENVVQSYSNAGISAINNSANGYSPSITVGVSWSNLLNSNSRGGAGRNWQLGSFNFVGNDGTNFITGAAIRSYLDGVINTNDMPARLEFLTTPDGSNTPVERMRITSDGKVGINEATPAVSLDLSSNTDAVSLPTGTTAQRPSGTDAYIRKNSTNNALEFYNGTNWVEIITDYFPTGSTTLG